MESRRVFFRGSTKDGQPKEISQEGYWEEPVNGFVDGSERQIDQEYP